VSESERYSKCYEDGRWCIKETIEGGSVFTFRNLTPDDCDTVLVFLNERDVLRAEVNLLTKAVAMNATLRVHLSDLRGKLDRAMWTLNAYAAERERNTRERERLMRELAKKEVQS